MRSSQFASEGGDWPANRNAQLGTASDRGGGVYATLPTKSSMDPSPIERFRPLKRVEYDKLIELGAFRDEKIELLEGLLVPMSPRGPPHCSAVQKLGTFFVV